MRIVVTTRVKFGERRAERFVYGRSVFGRHSIGVGGSLWRFTVPTVHIDDW